MIELSIVLILLLVSGVFSGTEVAFTSLSFEQVQRLRKDRGRSGRTAAELHDKLDTVLTSITIGNNLANLAASALVSAFTIRAFGEQWLSASTVALTILVLVIGEVTPKQIGIIHNETLALRLGRFLQVFAKVFAPLIWAVQGAGTALSSLAGGSKRPTVTVEGLHHLVRYARNAGLLNQTNAAVLGNTLRSRGVRVGAIMTHRTRVFSVERRQSADEVLKAMLEAGYSRVPVYDDDPERIVGLAMVRDLARAISEGQGSTSVGEYMVEPTFVPESKSFQAVLTRLRREHSNMAIVLDEYGGLAGLVTIEDLVEEFVGELYDEGETEDALPVRALEGGSYHIEGDAPLHVVQDHLEKDIAPGSEAQTIGGYVVDTLGRIPRAGEYVETSQGRLTVVRVGPSRIHVLRYDPLRQELP